MTKKPQKRDTHSEGGAEQKPPQDSDIRRQLEEQMALAEERLDQLKYLQADLENLRRQAKKEQEQTVRLATQRLITDLLPVLDGFAQAIPSLEGEENREGMALLHATLLKILGNHGLKKIEAAGRLFDPRLHEALLREPSDQPEGTVLAELQAGYTLNGAVIRPARVSVAAMKEGDAHGGEGKEGKDYRH